MLAALLALPILGGLLLFQSAIVSRVTLLHGVADLVLLALIAWSLQKRNRSVWFWGAIGGLMVGFMSALPFGAALVGYLLVVLLGVILRQRVWQMPILAMLIATFFGTLIVQLVELIALRIAGVNMPFWEAINLVTLPSVLLNLLLAIPFYAMFSDLAGWIYPEPLEV
jgi:rod shape-determining protein MreD